MLWSGSLGYLSDWEEGLATCHGIPIGAVARREGGDGGEGTMTIVEIERVERTTT